MARRGIDWLSGSMRPVFHERLARLPHLAAFLQQAKRERKDFGLLKDLRVRPRRKTGEGHENALYNAIAIRARNRGKTSNLNFRVSRLAGNILPVVSNLCSGMNELQLRYIIRWATRVKRQSQLLKTPKRFEIRPSLCHKLFKIRLRLSHSHGWVVIESLR